MVYAGGQFTAIGGQARNRIAGLDAATGAATAFDPNANGAVGVLTALDGVVYAGGQFTTIGGQPRNKIAGLNATTGVATAFDPDVVGTVRALTASDGVVYVGGSFSSIDGQPRQGVAAFKVQTTTVPSVGIEAPLPGGFVVGAAYPNPTRTAATVSVSVATAQRVRVEVFNVLGQRVATVLDGSVAPGAAQLVSVDVSGLAVGSYVVRVTGESFVESRRLTVVR